MRTGTARAWAMMGSLALTLAAACAESGTAGPTQAGESLAAKKAGAGVQAIPSTLQWNALAISLAGKNGLRNPFANRAYMLLSVAEARSLDALDAADFGGGEGDGRNTTRSAALGGAAVAVMNYLFPADQATIGATFAGVRAGAADLASFDAAAELGRAAGQAVADFAKSDGSGAVVVPVIPVGAGYWVPEGVVVTPQWPLVRPMLMSSGSQFRPPPPPAFGSAEFLAALAEVRHASDTRTAEQLAILNFWNDPIPAGGHGAHWNQIAVGLILAHDLNEARAVRVLESLNLALSDATIACFDAKYFYWYIRPYQADPLITTPLGKPGHASYPSQHSCQGGAAAGVLEHAFPQDAASIQAMEDEMDLSRLWAGLHYEFDISTGSQMGHQVAELAIARHDGSEF